MTEWMFYPAMLWRPPSPLQNNDVTFNCMASHHAYNSKQRFKNTNQQQPLALSLSDSTIDLPPALLDTEKRFRLSDAKTSRNANTDSGETQDELAIWHAAIIH